MTRPRSLGEAVSALAEHPDAQPLAGGTDLVVETNLGHRHPERIVALRRAEELREHRIDDGALELGAMVTYGDIETRLADEAPGLAMASRTVGSPQIRNAGTVGGNLGTASPAGDTLPWLLALDAEVELVSAEGSRRLPLAEFITGPKRTARRPDELIRAVRARRVAGPQHTAKIGPRNAMVISIACLSLILDTDHRRVRVGLGAVAATPVRPAEAEQAVSAAVDWHRLTCPDDAIARFADACAAATNPISDHRSTAEYRRHAVGVLADRALRRCLSA
ncbi:FAD binding domain-containing protein [Egibacter rhizosphaerae]|uniref:FAD binding domain-containing protein n=1 Tax=Egibacter rhizosphaerae TaxID=1670831 RepID=UPI001F110E7C|nr:FAD binding domain-containing protein [Egibacter rhizosphaerae]